FIHMGRRCYFVSLRQYSMGVQLIVCPEHSFSVYLYLYIWVGGAIVFPLDSTVWGYSLLCAQNIPSLYILQYGGTAYCVPRTFLLYIFVFIHMGRSCHIISQPIFLLHRGNNPPPCDVKLEQQTRWRLLYDVYQYFLPENNLNDTVLLAHLHRMSMVQPIISNGIKLLTLTSEQMTRVAFSSIPGQGVIYNVIVRDPLLNTSAAYVPVHTYACNFANVMDNCYTLGKASTKVFFTLFALFGLFICFFGHGFLKTEFFFMGFIIVGAFFFAILILELFLSSPALLGLTTVSGIIGGLLFVGFWWRFGYPLVCVMLVGLVLGFLMASIIFFTPVGDYATFHDDTVFWLTFTCISLVVPVAFLASAKLLNILTCAVVGSYTLVLAVDSYVFTSLTYITLNIVKRAVNQSFSGAYTSVPFQTNDFIMIALWVVLSVSGVATQLYREREKPPFPPAPYTLWKRDRERRKTNVLDPSYHLPPLRERVLLRLAQFREFFRGEQPTGERTPLLL
uniref:Anaphase-promoting complex subunit 16 n=2 Tax=Xenopus tropicalis TaxID=8364 RepID=A0A5S6KV29_XENTR